MYILYCRTRGQIQLHICIKVTVSECSQKTHGLHHYTGGNIGGPNPHFSWWPNPRFTKSSLCIKSHAYVTSEFSIRYINRDGFISGEHDFL